VSGGDWLADGACVALPRLQAELQGQAPSAAAKALCDICPVWRECLQHAYDLDLQWGYMGRLSAGARRHHGNADAAIVAASRKGDSQHPASR
jgi:hypothetical protein